MRVQRKRLCYTRFRAFLGSLAKLGLRNLMEQGF